MSRYNLSPSKSDPSYPHVSHPSRPACQAVAALYVRADQHAALRQAARGRRRDRPGHGQPEPIRPQELVIEKLAEAARDPQEPWLQQVERHRQPPPRGGQQVLQAVRRAARSRRRGDRLPRLEGGLQPHVPGPDGAGRHGDRARALLSGPRLRRGPGLGQRDLAGSGRQREVPVEHRLHLPAPLPAAEAADSSTIRTIRRRVVVEQAFYDEVVKLAKTLRLHGDQRLCLRRRGVRRLQAAQFPGLARGRSTWASSSRR